MWDSLDLFSYFFFFLVFFLLFFFSLLSFFTAIQLHLASKPLLKLLRCSWGDHCLQGTKSLRKGFCWLIAKMVTIFGGCCGWWCNVSNRMKKTFALIKFLCLPKIKVCDHCDDWVILTCRVDPNLHQDSGPILKSLSCELTRQRVEDTGWTCLLRW